MGPTVHASLSTHSGLAKAAYHKRQCRWDNCISGRAARVYRGFGYANLTVILSLQTSLDTNAALRIVGWQPNVATQELHVALQITRPIDFAFSWRFRRLVLYTRCVQGLAWHCRVVRVSSECPSLTPGSVALKPNRHILASCHCPRVTAEKGDLARRCLCFVTITFVQ